MASRLAKGSAAAALAVLVVGGFEGMRTHAYRDVVGIPTICFGETRGVRIGDKRTADQCRAMLGDRLIEFSKGIDACLVDEQHIPDKTYVAMTSLAYNIGVGQRAFKGRSGSGFCGSTVAARANAGNLRGACDAFLSWNRAGGRVIPGLDRRRREERTMCIEGLK